MMSEPDADACVYPYPNHPLLEHPFNLAFHAAISWKVPNFEVSRYPRDIKSP